MKTSHRLLLLAASLLAAGTASAQPITIDTVFVGDAGNDPQSSANRSHGVSGGDGFGAVSYGYHIGTTPVTNAQYAAFLNAVAATDPHGLWNSDMGSSVHGGITRSGDDGSYTYSVRTADSGFNDGQSMANMPVNFVSFWSAARFTNWLTSGNTESGVYLLTTDGISNNTITRDATAWANGGVAIASENEWFKAAYYDPTLNDGDGGYWLYPTQSNSLPTPTTPNSTNANSMNFDFAVGTVTEVGSYTLADSHYGTFDQGGNVLEWSDEIVTSSTRVLRGGSFFSSVFDNQVPSSYSVNLNPTVEGSSVGFRVTSLGAIPEPSTYAFGFGVIALALAAFRRMRIRKGQS